MPRVREDYPYLWHLCFEEVRPETGTDYPCTARQLRDIRHPPMLRYPRPISPHEACDALVDFLSRVPRPGSKTDAALCRIGDALDLIDWGPDLIIKAFHDLDRAFFATTLTGMTTVDWFANREFQAMGCPPAYGMTTSLYPGPQAIYLNARNIFRTGQAGHFSQMWQTMLHEMMHAYYNIICGHYNRVAHGPVFREAMLAVDRRWRYCFRLRAIKYVDGLIEGIDGVD